MNNIQKAGAIGQSIWLDYIDEALLNGELNKWIEKGVKGVTSNPAIFEKAIKQSTKVIPTSKTIKEAEDAFVDLSISEIRRAAEILTPCYEAERGKDGMVSIEINPTLANMVEESIKEGERLADEINMKNLMLKVPATPSGMEVIKQLTAKGRNVNATLLFSVEAYRNTLDAYMCGLEARVKNNEDIHTIVSVASFFVSRIDAAVDDLLKGEYADLQGRVAIANAKLAYEHFLKVCNSERWKKLENAGANKQRLLWASTGVKNPAYKKTLYIDELIGVDTVNTVPPGTLKAFMADGSAKETINCDFSDAKEVIRRLSESGIVLNQITDNLLEDGVCKFVKSYNGIINLIMRS